MAKIRILAIGDVVSDSGTAFIRRNLWNFRREKKIDAVVVNGENSGERSSIDKTSAETLIEAGADVITTGNHVWTNRGFESYLEDSSVVLRPANFPSECVGNGYTVIDVSGYRMLVISLQGTAFMESLESPFLKTDAILEREKGSFDFAVVDFHAEATSEKIAFAFDFDGRVSAVWGTHTHIQTNDARILQGGTGYITDLGMTGVYDSVLGLEPECMIRKFRTRMPARHKIAEGEVVMSGAIFTLDTDTFRCIDIETVNFRE